MHSKKYNRVLQAFAGRNVLVIGDFMIDIFLEGISSRLSPEAPVPVVNVRKETVLAGGAGNTACNLAALGARVTCCTVLGDDAEAIRAMTLMKEAGVNTAAVVIDTPRQTIVKTRIVAEPHHNIARFDRGTETRISDQAETICTSYIREFGPRFDAIVISDYDKGMITGNVLRALCDIRSRCPYVAVDSKRLTFFQPLRASMAKPNYAEAVALAGNHTDVKDRILRITQIAHDLCECTGAHTVAVTLDREGSLILENGRVVCRVQAHRIALPFVAGAGDTYISAFVLAALAGAPVTVCAELASQAACIAVSQQHTGRCTWDELKDRVGGSDKVSHTVASLVRQCDRYRAEGRRIVFTNGCFDILHRGHVSYLNDARTLGDVLIVAVNTDESIRRLKGPSRPINTLGDRMSVLAALHAVDHIIPFGAKQNDMPATLITAIRPDVFVKGEDYAGHPLPEAPALASVGCETIFLPFIPDQSTTRTIARIHEQITLADNHAHHKHQISMIE